ncbi:MAG: Tyrosine-tRNA ligase [Candidatus Moranbacteria bacterium GW2011_GWE2_35_2-]|nr:MAG: Tyrosine-tRNA ligase [Candidatus Moranbacteria bacterium GW2011_GWE2_35_2-]KKQ29334.1 MAG: Tyrosine-tRNA ligase [Candidatus Moranbacteria bacterium GW2011_GWD1_37_17]KKQ30793.1 MAG: Tyrosine-tRNA ligase [Candidatus Moranbacteria bacterium GW2011_GWE1_37_24]KKQ48004.1 MAG: Tyrosine-tRNA ligase [Candidatus Moranbacteria bacterium GW2011_GWD2_37_9]HBO17011.1 tyrosine--tRNA ligase [Candidatus Moranbacteria bacterium]
MDKKELEKKVDEILERGVLVEFLPTKKEFREKLLFGEKLRFYIGADPTAKALHLGHAQNLMILEDFRKLGHEVIFLIGDFTGMIGDPTDKGAARVRQTREGVEENFKNWLEQTKNILSFDDKDNPVKVKYNSEWLSKLNFEQVIDIASNFTVQQMLERDMFENRMKEGKPIHLHEFLYPLMQGYDSVAMDVDVELCGTDQIFNALAGRTLMQKIKGKDKFVISAKLIADEKTGMLMSKSNGTGIFLDLDSNDLFGAIMSQPDGMIHPLLLGCTRISLDEIKELMKLENPRDAKVRLAHEIVKIYHGEEKSQEAEEYFVNTFSKKEIPEEVREVKAGGDINFIDFLVLANVATSRGDARRKIEQGGVSIEGEKITDPNKVLDISFSGKIIKVGKKDFVKIVF